MPAQRAEGTNAVRSCASRPFKEKPDEEVGLKTTVKENAGLSAVCRRTVVAPSRGIAVEYTDSACPPQGLRGVGVWPAWLCVAFRVGLA